MTEVNKRWLRANRFLKLSTAYGVTLAVVLWPISYAASFSAAQSGQGVWFSVVSGATLIGALVATVGSAIGLGAVLTDAPPLPGDNR